MISAGKLRHRVTVIKRGAGPVNAIGEAVATDVAAAKRWAHVEPVQADARNVAAGMKLDTTHRVTMRHQPGDRDIVALDLDDGRRLDVQCVIDVDERHVETRAMCREYSPEGGDR